MNYAEFYRKNAGKNVKATMTDGEVFSGELFSYTSAKDNDPEPESVVVGYTELFTNEIEQIEVIL